MSTNNMQAAERAAVEDKCRSRTTNTKRRRVATYGRRRTNEEGALLQ